MFGLGVQELLLILVIILIFFGADKIPQLARSLGKGMTEFRKAQQDLKAELEQSELQVDSYAPPLQTSAPEIGDLKPTYAICPGCHGKTVESSLYCSNCGRPMVGEPVCDVCQRSYREDEKFCPNCGHSRVALQG